MLWVSRLFLCSLVCAFLLCLRTTSVDAQEHPFQLTPSVERAFERYMNKGNRGAFALSLDGQHAGFSFCKHSAMCGWGQRNKSERTALQACQRIAGSVPCKIYAWRGRVIWEGEAPKVVHGTSAKHARCDRDKQRSVVSEEQIGWGDLTLSSKLMEAYHNFKGRPGTGYFFLSMSGGAYGYHFCEYESCNFDSCLAKAREACEDHSLVSCFMMADKTGLVWDGAVRGPGGRQLTGAADE